MGQQLLCLRGQRGAQEQQRGRATGQRRTQRRLIGTGLQALAQRPQVAGQRGRRLGPEAAAEQARRRLVGQPGHGLVAGLVACVGFCVVLGAVRRGWQGRWLRQQAAHGVQQRLRIGVARQDMA